MFENKKTLIVVYKDELLMNQLKKMVETRDDGKQTIIGTKDGSINIVAWTEKMWLDNKKAGNLKGKILFLGEMKSTDKLIPVIDEKFYEYGVKYGWAGNQAIVYAEPKALITREDYDAFLKKLSALPVPEFLKGIKESIVDENAEHKDEASVEPPAEDAEKEDNKTAENSDKKHKKADISKVSKKMHSTEPNAFRKAGARVASKFEETFRNKSLMKRQMLFYGVVSLYNNGLEEFMNL